MKGIKFICCVFMVVAMSAKSLKQKYGGGGKDQVQYVGAGSLGNGKYGGLPVESQDQVQNIGKGLAGK